jgi:S-adenosylmethionine:tRNA ribosyltransferase-isomerase
MRTSDFEYQLPAELIAQEPLPDRAASRLLVLDRATGQVQHDLFRNVAGYFEPGDVLVINDSRVSSFRLRGRRPSGAAVEALILERVDGSTYRALMKPGRRLHPGDRVLFADGLEGTVLKREDDGSRLLELSAAGGDLTAALGRQAEAPLPPYIRKPLKAKERYQTVYSAVDGSTAAPTAGLHFTAEMLREVERAGVRIARITLHVGASTFRPVRAESLEEHRLAGERFTISREAADTVNQAAGRVFAVGTTSTRALEAAAVSPGTVAPMDGQTDLFIRPGHEFRIVKGLVTNFHMPRSTLFVLVAAFAGREKLLRAYSEAVRERYRFLSLGDAMLVV